VPVINEDIYLELLEVLELYSEVLIARFGMLDQKYVTLSPHLRMAYLMSLEHTVLVTQTLR
jgi:hypothetical protein